MISVELAPGAEDNGLASMLADLVRQNLEAKPRKVKDFEALKCNVSIVAEDADVALTMRFDRGHLIIHDGIVGIPDVTVRATADMVIALSNMPISTRFALPFAKRGDKEGRATADAISAATKSGEFKVYGAMLHPRLMLRLTRVMSVNG